MKLLIVLCCVVGVSLAFPGMFNRRESPPIVTEVLPTNSSIVNKRNSIEKRMDDVQGAFAAIDADRNGHISSEEFSTFFVYVYAGMPDHEHSKSEWSTIFNKVLTLVDINENNKLEMGEFREFSVMDMPEL
ncbi:uncharacterized protein [Mytilus edulis]|uniref:uncharacterized protein n=1 Tax=Mytilus edulis TaxID=6550 RepID=UPI0039F08544